MNEPEISSATAGSFIESLASVAPMSESDYMTHVFKTEIIPTVERWGFDTRFLKQAKPLTKKQSATMESVAGRMSGIGAIVALVGARGTGKTTITARIAIERAWKNWHEARAAKPLHFHSVIYRKCSTIVDRYKPLFADFGSLEVESLRNSMEYLCKEQEFLVIDELHECADMKFKRVILSDLIDRRYSHLRDTIIIANQTAADFEATIGDSILSRLHEHGLIIPCNWPSFRVQP